MYYNEKSVLKFDTDTELESKLSLFNNIVVEKTIMSTLSTVNVLQ